MDNKFARFLPHAWRCAVSSVERHSSWLDWLPITGCLAAAIAPPIISLLPNEIRAYHWWLQFASDHARTISGLGIIGFLSLMLWHSFLLYDELAERISYKRMDGMWKRTSDPLSGIYQLEGIKITGDFAGPIWEHKSKGHYDPDVGKFLIKIIRERPNHSCRATLLGTLEILNEDALKCHVYESDGGHPDVPIGVTEVSFFERVKGA